MKKNFKIIFSFDYELFFGIRSGTVLKSLIQPTNQLMTAMEQNGFRGNFFVDYMMLDKLEKQEDNQSRIDLRLIKEQLRDMVRRGHRIELHLHPHWIDAKYNGDGTWDFSNFIHYSLSSLDEKNIIELFTAGKNYLTNLVNDICPNYKLCAFRAGGWAVQPFDKLKRAFIEAGITIDSSVARGAYGKNQFSSFDFTPPLLPQKTYYRFSTDVCVENVNGPFLEIPITSYTRHTFPYRIIDKMIRIFTSSIDCKTDGTHKRYDLIREKRASRLSMMTMCRISTFCAILSYLLNRKKLTVFIDHPKDFTISTISTIKQLSKLAQSTTYMELLNGLQR